VRSLIISARIAANPSQRDTVILTWKRGSAKAGTQAAEFVAHELDCRALSEIGRLAFEVLQRNNLTGLGRNGEKDSITRSRLRLWSDCGGRWASRILHTSS
jgi:hypothetical protein